MLRLVGQQRHCLSMCLKPLAAASILPKRAKRPWAHKQYQAPRKQARELKVLCLLFRSPLRVPDCLAVHRWATMSRTQQAAPSFHPPPRKPRYSASQAQTLVLEVNPAQAYSVDSQVARSLPPVRRLHHQLRKITLHSPVEPSVRFLHCLQPLEIRSNTQMVGSAVLEQSLLRVVRLSHFLGERLGVKLRAHGRHLRPQEDYSLNLSRLSQVSLIFLQDCL